MGFISNIANAISSGVDAAQEAAGNAAEAVGDAVNSVVDGAQQAGTDAAQWADGAVEDAAEGIGGAIESAQEVGRTVVDAIANTSPRDIVEGIARFNQEVQDRAMQTLDCIGDRLGEAGTAIQESIRNGAAAVQAAANDARAFIEEKGEQGVDALREGIGMVRSKGEEAAAAIEARFNDARGAAVEFLSDNYDAAAELIDNGVDFLAERRAEAQAEAERAKENAARAADYAYNTSFGEMANDLVAFLRSA